MTSNTKKLYNSSMEQSGFYIDNVQKFSTARLTVELLVRFSYVPMYLNKRNAASFGLAFDLCRINSLRVEEIAFRKNFK